MLLMGKSTISIAIFNSFLYVYQRVLGIYTLNTYLYSILYILISSGSENQFAMEAWEVHL